MIVVSTVYLLEGTEYDSMDDALVEAKRLVGIDGEPRLIETCTKVQELGD